MPSPNVDCDIPPRRESDVHFSEPTSENGTSVSPYVILDCIIRAD